MSATVTVAEYLATRLRQLGVEHLFGVPGDFNLKLLAALVERDTPAWIGTATELGAAYAADGYARRRGFGALLTTFGVGELSALNGIAGARAERVPVLQITGAPATHAVGLPLHHTLLDGDLGHFARATAGFAVAHATLRPLDAGRTIDAVLRAMLDRHGPGYICLPEDLVHHPVDAAPLRGPLAPRAGDRRRVRVAAALVEAGLRTAEAPVLLAGAGVRRAGAVTALRDVAERSGVPVATLGDAKGVLDEHDALALGTYAGAALDGPAREAVESADLIVTVGAVLSDTLTGGFTARVDAATRIDVGLDGVRDQHRHVADVRLRDVLDLVATRRRRPPAIERAAPRAAAPAGEPLTQDELWRAFARELPQGQTVVADIGTSYFGLLGEPLPPDTVFEAQPQWASIGYALAAGLGTQLADPGRRTVVVTGDGAAQMTVPELGTMFRHGLRPIIVLVDNDGYTIERAINAPNALYHDVATWSWPRLARALGSDVRVLEAATGGELADVLVRAHADRGRLVFVHVRTDRHDVPSALATLAAAVAERVTP